MLVAGLAAVVLLVGGGGAYWKFGASAPAAAPAEPPAVVDLEPFVVNLADTDGKRFLRVSLTLVVEGEQHAKAFEEDAVARAMVRSAILERLTQLSSDTLVTPGGKAALKKVITEIVGHHAAHLKISDVVFSEFIVQ
jgi:flagellar FliL protein